MKRLKIGTQLIARETLYMNDEDEDMCLEKDKVYPIRRLDKDYAIIDSEICNGHYWPIDEVYLNFIVPNIELSKQIKVL